MVVCLLVEAPREQVLADVVLALLARTGEIAIARVEALGQKQKTADAIAVLLKVARMRELVGVALWVVGPDVLDLVAIPAALGILAVAGGLTRASLHVVGHARQQPVDLAAVHAVQSEAVVAREGLCLGVETLAQHRRQFRRALAADVAHHEEHRVLHRRVVDGAPVPDATIDQDVEIRGHHADLAQRGRLVVVHPQRREQHGILQREVVLGVEVDALEPSRERLGGAAQAFVPAAVEGKVPLDKAGELGARRETEVIR